MSISRQFQNRSAPKKGTAKNEVSDPSVKLAAGKVAVSIRLDQEVVEFFKSQGDRWQTRINHILREAAGLK